MQILKGDALEDTHTLELESERLAAESRAADKRLRTRELILAVGKIEDVDSQLAHLVVKAYAVLTELAGFVDAKPVVKSSSLGASFSKALWELDAGIRSVNMYSLT